MAKEGQRSLSNLFGVVVGGGLIDGDDEGNVGDWKERGRKMKKIRPRLEK